MRQAIFLISALALSPGAASAQLNTLEADNPREEATLRLGPLFVTPVLELKDLGIDNNVFNDASGRRKDFTFTLAPQARVWLPFARRVLIKAEVGTDVVWYRKFASERSVDPDLGGRAEIYFRRFTLFGANRFQYTRQRQDFDLDLRSRRKVQDLEGGLDFRITPKLSLELHGTSSRTRLDADAVLFGTPLERTLNRDRLGWGAVARHKLTPLTTLVVKGDAFADRFPLARERDARGLRVLSGFELKPRALIQGSAFVGFRSLEPDDATKFSSFSGLAADLNLAHTVLGATTFTVSYLRDLSYSYEVLQPYYVDDSLSLRVRRALGRRFDVIASTDYHRYAYRDLAPAGTAAVLPLTARVDTVRNLAGSLGYNLRRDLRAGLGASYWRRKSTTREFRNYDGLRVGTTVTYGF